MSNLFKLSHDFLCILCVEVSLQENSQLSVKLIWIFNILNCGFLFNRQMEFTSINYPVITQTRCICQSIFSRIIKYILGHGSVAQSVIKVNQFSGKLYLKWFFFPIKWYFPQKFPLSVFTSKKKFFPGEWENLTPW